MESKHHLKKEDYTIASNPKKEFFKKGTIIFSDKEPNNSQMYLLQQGKVRIFTKVNNEEIEFDVLGPGEIFGELSIFDNQPRSATAEVIEDAKVIIINKNMINEQLEKLPTWFKKFLKIITLRLRDADDFITQLILEKKLDKKPKTAIPINDQ